MLLVEGESGLFAKAQRDKKNVEYSLVSNSNSNSKNNPSDFAEGFLIRQATTFGCGVCFPEGTIFFTRNGLPFGFLFFSFLFYVSLFFLSHFFPQNKIK